MGAWSRILITVPARQALRWVIAVHATEGSVIGRLEKNARFLQTENRNLFNRSRSRHPCRVKGPKKAWLGVQNQR